MNTPHVGAARLGHGVFISLTGSARLFSLTLAVQHKLRAKRSHYAYPLAEIYYLFP